MGKRPKFEEKVPLVQYFYKNTVLIDSLYSQLFQGDLSEVTRSSSEHEGKTNKYNVQLPQLAGYSREHSKEELLGIIQSVDPHDFKINNLLSELSPAPFTPHTTEGRVVSVEGKLIMFIKEIAQRNIPQLEDLTVLNVLYNVELDEDDEILKEVGMEKFLKTCLELMPSGVSMALSSGNKEFACLTEDKFFVVDPEKLASTFGGELSGIFTVTGIYMKRKLISDKDIGRIASSEDWARAVMAFQDSPLAVLQFSKSQDVIVPIIITKKIEY